MLSDILNHSAYIMPEVIKIDYYEDTSYGVLDIILQITFTYTLFYLVKSFYDIISPNQIYY